MAGEQVREESHVGRTARVGVIAEIGEGDAGLLQPPLHESVDGFAAILFAEDYQ